MQLIVQSPIIQKWLDKSDPFTQLNKLEGEVVRDKEGRTTKRVEINGEGFFLKYHRGVGWKEILKNLIQLRLPVTSAANEFNAINRLNELGVDTMTIAAYGKKGLNPARQHSFILTEELTCTENLEDLNQAWRNTPQTRRKLIKRVARIARTLHNNGINHRDFYICHFMLDLTSATADAPNPDAPLYLIDLHRTQIRKKVPQRWLVKDLASLYFSVLDFDMKQRDIFLFLSCYFDRPLRNILQENQSLFKQVEHRAFKLYLRDFGKLPDRLPVKPVGRQAF